jgi:hypothetical protein
MALHDVYRNNFFFTGRGIRVGGLFRNKIHVLVFVSYFEVVFHVPTVASSNCALLTAGSERTCAAYTADVLMTTAVAVSVASKNFLDL